MTYSKYIIGILILLILDILWIKFFMLQRYNTLVKNIQNSPLIPNLKYASFAYLLMILGLILFVLPNIKKNNLFKDSLIYGALFGFILYGVYNFTCLTIFTNWDIKTSIYDIFWGTIVYFIASYFAIKFSK